MPLLCTFELLYWFDNLRRYVSNGKRPQGYMEDYFMRVNMDQRLVGRFFFLNFKGVLSYFMESEELVKKLCFVVHIEFSIYTGRQYPG